MSGLYAVATIISLVFYIALLNRLFRFHLRPYFPLFFYILILLFTILLDGTLIYLKFESLWGYPQRTVFYFNDLLRQAMVYLLVISLILSAVRGSERFRWVGRWLVLGAVLLAGLFAWFHYDERVARWMTNLIRNLSLMAMLMNLALWMLLLKNRTADRTLLLVTTGLGLQMAGEAMGQSLRLMNPATETLGNIVLVLAHLCCLWVWYLAFRPKKGLPATG